jgi:hypothetical protein
VLLENRDRPRRREVPTLAVRSAQLHRRDRLDVALEFRRRGDLGLAAVRAMQRLRPDLLAQPAVERGA